MKQKIYHKNEFQKNKVLKEVLPVDKFTFNI